MQIVALVEIPLDLSNLHDVLTEFVEVDKLTAPYLIERFNALPNSIKATALAWEPATQNFGMKCTCTIEITTIYFERKLKCLKSHVNNLTTKF